MLETLLTSGKGQYYPDSGPGNKLLTMGNSKAGFFGEVTSDELFSGPELVSLTRVTNAGEITAQPVWLKFAFEGRFLFIAKFPIAMAVTWNELYRCGLVFGTDNKGFNPFGGFDGDVNQITIVEKDGVKFKVRLIQDQEPLPNLTTASIQDLNINRDTEWNQLMYRVSDSNEFASLDPPPPRPWVKYTPPELGVYYNSVIAMLTDLAGSNVVSRGVNTVSVIRALPRTTAAAWRPVLEVLTGRELFKAVNHTYQTTGGLIPPGDTIGEVIPTSGFTLPPSAFASGLSEIEVLRAYDLRFEIPGNLLPLSIPVGVTGPRLPECDPPSAVTHETTGDLALRSTSLGYDASTPIEPLGGLASKVSGGIVAPGGIQSRLEIT